MKKARPTARDTPSPIAAALARLRTEDAARQAAALEQDDELQAARAALAPWLEPTRMRVAEVRRFADDTANDRHAAEAVAELLGASPQAHEIMRRLGECDPSGFIRQTKEALDAAERATAGPSKVRGTLVGEVGGYIQIMRAYPTVEVFRARFAALEAYVESVSLLPARDRAAVQVPDELDLARRGAPAAPGPIELRFV